MKVKAIVWAKECKIDPKFKKGRGKDYWGDLHGSFDKVIPTSQTAKRKVTIHWTNLGKKAASNFTKGRDLNFKKESSGLISKYPIYDRRKRRRFRNLDSRL